jgi:predicted transposase/invertase (TIGR01784 family)
LAVLEKLEQIASVASLTKQEALEYERTLNDYRTAEATWELAEERGEAKGKAKGKAENKLETARTMKQRNYPIDEIMAITGLSREEIEQA